MWVYCERKENECRTHRTAGTGTSQLGDQEVRHEMVFTSEICDIDWIERYTAMEAE